MVVPISGGVSDTVDVAVVGIVDGESSATCSGALIAPDLVVTAQHCVVDAVMPGACADATLGAPLAASRFYVTTRLTMTASPSDYHAVAEIRIPPGGDALCGRDIALLVLAAPIAASEAAPIDARLDALIPAEVYAAVGYGAIDDQGTGAGERRRRDDLMVACVGDGCAGGFIGTAEWMGEAGVCMGDSGGPALDADGAVVGVASRGAAGCVSPTYTRIDAHASWLIDEAVRAAELGGYEVPAWAGGGAPDAGPSVDDPDTAGCCQGSRDTGGVGALALIVVGAVTRRRGRRGA